MEQAQKEEKTKHEETRQDHTDVQSIHTRTLDSLPTPPPAVSTVLTDYAEKSRRRVLMGTCGWNDVTIGKCGRFYPSSIKTPTERLRHYSTHFPCVEVDTSNYAIPHTDRIAEWMAQTPPTFQFHFKIFGLFTAISVPYNSIPGSVRHLIHEKQIRNGKVKLQDTSDAFKQALWSLWNQTLRPVHNAGKLGLVVFQFHLGFLPTAENKKYIEWCRSMLDSDFRMGIEFRSRAWFKVNEKQETYTDEDFLTKTINFARRVDCALIAEDDLAHEVVGRFIPLPPGQEPVHLPIELHVAATHSLYIRLHRRQGNQRVLADWEFEAWAKRLAQARDTAQVELDGPIFFLWGTDWEDQPVINSKKMMSALQTFDAQRQEEYEKQLKANSEAPAAAASSSSSSAAALASPEPLAFDYPRYYKQVLSRLPNAHAASTASQLSLGAFFKQKPEPNGSTKENANASAPRHETQLAAASHLHPPSSAASSPFVLASSLKVPAAAKSSFISSIASPGSSTSSSVVSSVSSDTVHEAPPAASSASAVDPVPMITDSDIAAEVAAIERQYEQQKSLASSPAKRKTPPVGATPSPAKKMKGNSANKKAVSAAVGSSIASFFKKI